MLNLEGFYTCSLNYQEHDNQDNMSVSYILPYTPLLYFSSVRVTE